MSTITDQMADALRAIRSGELDGSEPAVVELLAEYDARAAVPPAPSLHNHARIRWELEATAAGKAYYGGALRVALDLPGIDADDRAVLNRWSTGTQNSTDHIRLQEVANKVKPEPEARPRIGIKIEGGVIQHVFADTDASIYVIDYDVEDASPPSDYEDENQLICELAQDNGSTAECVLSRYDAEITPVWFGRMDAAMSARFEELHDNTEAPRP